MLLSVSSTMGIVFDVLIVGILVVLGLIGFRKGFFKSVISLFSTLVVIIISFMFAGHLARLVNKIYDFTGLIAGKLSSGIASMGTFYSEPIPAGVSGQDIINNIPSSTNGFLKKLMSYVLEPLSASDVEGATVADIVSGSFASIIMLIISAIVLFIAIKIIIAIASRLFDNITRNRVFGAANKLGGLAFGVVKGFLIVIIFTVVLTLLTVIPTVNTKLTPIIQDNTKIARPVYNYTDEFIEKHVIDGKIVQKWIDNLWENKYKDRGDDTPVLEPNGTVERPYQITLT
ncbi:MAG: CvpA family protein [Clostridia bacterium]|nr:CvpA family protein [Clostridia bacterium]